MPRIRNHTQLHVQASQRNSQSPVNMAAILRRLTSVKKSMRLRVPLHRPCPFANIVEAQALSLEAKHSVRHRTGGAAPSTSSTVRPQNRVRPPFTAISWPVMKFSRLEVRTRRYERKRRGGDTWPAFGSL